MSIRRMILSAVAFTALVGAIVPVASASPYGHCYYRHHHRICHR